MEDFYIGGAALTRPVGYPLPSDGRGAGGEGWNFPEIVDIALPAEGVFHNLVFVSIRKTYPMQAYKVLADGHQCTASGA
jgi:4-hydroxy-3-polyprenylbenzoate decarboxylase